MRNLWAVVALLVLGLGRLEAQCTIVLPNPITGLPDLVNCTGAGTGDLLAANNLSDVANAATARTNLGLAIGTNVQAWDADLDTLAGLAKTANYIIGANAAGNAWEIKQIIQGANMTITPGAGSITFASSAGGVVSAKRSITRTSDTLVDFGAGLSRVGATVYSYPASSAEVTAGTGTVRGYVDADGVWTIGYTAASGITCTDCTFVGSVSDWPDDSFPVFQCDTVSGEWDTTCLDLQSLGRERKLVAGDNISLTEAADSVTVASTASGSSYDPLDMTVEVFDTWILGSSNIPSGWHHSASCLGLGSPTGVQGPVYSYWATPGTSGTYCLLFMNNLLAQGSARYPDFVSSGNFKAFTYVARLRATVTSNTALRFGAFSANEINPQGVYLEYDSSASANWRCVVNDGSATATDTGVAASTSPVTVKISATAAGTLSCSVGSTTVTAVDTFPAATFWGVSSRADENLNKGFELASPKIRFTGLTR